MTAQLLASELSNLIQESKRKHNDLRQVPRALSLLFLQLSPLPLVGGEDIFSCSFSVLTPLRLPKNPSRSSRT